MNEIYVKSVTQVTNQSPLTDEWFLNPAIPEDDFYFCQEPSVREFVSPVEARRMSKVLRRTLATSLTALREAEVEMPDAIITGTGMGCIENSEKFLVDISKYDEEMLKPTLFMQSTHNTISSLIAIRLHCHGYNNTYSHKGISFESALLDGWLQLHTLQAQTVLLGCHDELTRTLGTVMRYTHPEYAHPSESSMACVLQSDNSDGRALCKVDWVRILSNSDAHYVAELIDQSGCDAMITGINGNDLNDNAYRDVLSKLKSEPLILRYRHILGDNFSISAMGFYCAAKILAIGKIPAWMLLKDDALMQGGSNVNESCRSVLILNRDYDMSWGITKLSIA